MTETPDYEKPCEPTYPLPEGSNTGDIIRWNEALEAWESKAEPIEFEAIILTPRTTPLNPVEGTIYYKASDNGVYVAVE